MVNGIVNGTCMYYIRQTSGKNEYIIFIYLAATGVKIVNMFLLIL